MHTSEKYWIGLNNKDLKGDFKWVDGSSMTYHNFKYGQGVNGVFIHHSNLGCVVMDNTGYWYDNACSTKPLDWNSKPFICEFKMPVQKSSCWRSDKPASKNAIEHDGKCYTFVHDLPYTYAEAQKHCEQIGNSLALIKTQQINNALTWALQKRGLTNVEFWIGLNYDKTKDFHLRWEDGTSMRFNSFDLTTGTIYDKVDKSVTGCTTMKSTGYWDINHCNNRKYYICEYNK